MFAASALTGWGISPAPHSILSCFYHFTVFSPMKKYINFHLVSTWNYPVCLGALLECSSILSAFRHIFWKQMPSIHACTPASCVPSMVLWVLKAMMNLATRYNVCPNTFLCILHLIVIVQKDKIQLIKNILYILSYSCYDFIFSVNNINTMIIKHRMFLPKH